MISVTVNGERRALEDGATVAQLLRDLGLQASAEPRGVAVALDGEVVPRSQWGATTVHSEARLEVLTAVGGG